MRFSRLHRGVAHNILSISRAVAFGPVCGGGRSCSSGGSMNEIPPPPEYRLNLRVVLMSFLIWIGIFLVFAGISVTLAMTTNAPYFLFIIIGAGGVHVGDGFLQARRAMGTDDAVQPDVQARARSSRASFRGGKVVGLPAFTVSQERDTFGPPALYQRHDYAARFFLVTWAALAGGRHVDGGLPSLGIPASGTRRRGPQSVDDHARQLPNQCEHVTRVSCHQPYGCYESHVQRTTYEKFHKVSDNIDVIKCIERSEVVTMESAMAPSPEPPSVTIPMEEPVEPVMPEKKKRVIFLNIFSRNNDKIIVKKFPLSKSEDNECIASLLYEESAAPTDPLCSTRGPKGIADSSGLAKVIANIERSDAFWP
ncbi:hypothetical protein MRX96_019574 [Rhipicephalus microplus]